jgi:hypothetical protein
MKKSFKKCRISNETDGYEDLVASDCDGDMSSTRQADSSESVK